MPERIMKDSGIALFGYIPNNWSVMKLKHIKSKEKYSIVDGPFGTAISTDDYVDDGIPLVRITNLKSPYVVKDDLVYITKEHAENLQRSRLNYGDIVFAKTGATIGKCAINHEIEYGILSSSCVKIALDEKYNRKYFYYLFFTNEFNTLLKDACVGTTRDTINLVPFSNLKVCVPSTEEQTKIAKFLDDKISQIDNAISKTKESIEEYRKLKQSIITEAVTKGLDPNVEMKDSGIEWIGSIPQTWKLKKLKFATKIRNQKWLQEDGHLDYFALENIESWSSKYIKTDSMYDLEGSQICKKNDVVFGKLRPYLAKTFLVDYDRCCSSEFAVMYDFEGLQEYLLYLVTSTEFVNEVNMSTYGTKMPRANIEFIKNMTIPIPDIKGQQMIVNYLKNKCLEFDDLISKKEKIVEELEQYKKSLIYEYVTGKKEVA